MKVLSVRNVCEALPAGLAYLLTEGAVRETRAGPALTAPGPVTTHYARPRERVLFNAVRDSNPFFTLLESLWMLAGRDDTAFLDRYVRDFGKRFGEEYDGSLHGAYGARWREGMGFDQLAFIVRQLRNDPGTRQAVLQMWDATEDCIRGANDLMGVWRDRPCNLSVVFRMRRGELDMLVNCRSNDAIMGAYGANAVHMSLLQEYVAGMVGVPVGQYWQVSADLHAYTADVDRLCKRGKCSTPEYNTPRQQIHEKILPSTLRDDRYDMARPVANKVRHSPSLITYPESFDAELSIFMHYVDWLHADGLYAVGDPPAWKNTFLRRTAWPVACLHWIHKNEKEYFEKKEYVRTKVLGKDWRVVCAEIEAEDWRTACAEWVQRRTKK